MTANRSITVPRWLWIFDIGFTAEKAGRMPGYAPFAGTLATIVMIAIGGRQLGLTVGWLISIVGVLDVIATRHFLSASLQRLKHLGVRGPSRAWWWIEAAGVCATLAGTFGIYWLVHAFLGQQVPGLAGVLLNVAAALVPPLYVACLAIGTVGFALGLLQRRRVSGHALELVAFIYWTSVLCWLSYQIPQPMMVMQWTLILLAIVAAGAIAAAAWVHWSSRWNQGGTNGGSDAEGPAPVPAPVRPRPADFVHAEIAAGQS